MASASKEELKRFDLVDSADLQSVEAVEAELHRRLHEDPLAHTYKPHAKQLEVHRSRKPITVVLGGNRSGKSWCSAAEAMLYCTGRVVYADVPEPPVEVWYIMPSLTQFKRSIQPTFERLMPRKEIRRIRRKQGAIDVIEFKNGSRLHIVSADMKLRRLQGADVDLAIMDETPDETIFEEIQARVLLRHGRIILAFSPTELASYWVRDKIYVPWAAGDRKDIDVVMMPIADEHGNPLVPHVTRAEIQRMEQQWPDPNVRAARMYGQFATRTGLVFKKFDPQAHIVKSFDIPDHFARWMICDPQYHRFSVLYFAADDKGTYYITDEYFSQDETLARRSEKLGWLVGKRDTAVPMYVDSANPQDTAELNWHFRRLGVPISAIPLPLKKRVDDFVLRVQALLEPNDEDKYPAETKMDCYGAPRLLFFDRLMSKWRWKEREMSCSRLLWELQRLSWGKDGKPDKDSADGGDATDCLIYGSSIMAAGSRQEETPAWKKGLSYGDLLIYDAIDRMEVRQMLQDRY